MANEAVLIYRLEHPVEMTVADATALEKGAFVVIGDNKVVTASAHAGACGGIVAREKIALSGRTGVAVFRKGTFNCLLSGACSAGEPLMMAESNQVMIAGDTSVAASGAICIGSANMDGTDGETIQIELNIQ